VRWVAGALVLAVVAAVLTVLVRAGTFDAELTPADVTSVGGGAAEAAPATDAAMFDLERPFEPTPAATWADGAEGIVLPTAKPVGDFSASEVAAALEQVREVLVASRLDRALMVDHDPTRFLSLLAPDARRQLAPLFDGREPDVQSLVSMASAGTALLPAQPKVRGEISVSEGGAGELVVHTNYVFVYAFQPAQPLRLVDAMDTIVVVRADVDYVLRAGERWAEGSQGLWYGQATGYAYSIGCAEYRRGFLAPATSERAVTPDTTGEPASYFDPASPVRSTEGCSA
jgi:hypothetical protein